MFCLKYNLEDYLLQIITGQRKGLRESIILFFLYVLEKVYLLLVYIRIFIYKIGLKKSKKLDCQVVSVGNITVGGTGKTPMVSLLADKYKNNGFKVAVVSRGYKGDNSKVKVVSNGQKILISKEDAGDEAFMLSQMLSGVPVVIGKDRYSAGKLAVKEFEPDLILLDDGFQHWQLDRDREVVLIDAINPFGYMHLIPAGLLREPLTGLKRADSIVITKANNVTEDNLKKICNKLKYYNDKAVIYFARYQIKHIKIHCKGENKCNNNEDDFLYNKDMQMDRESNIAKTGVDFLVGKKVLAFSGIGNPISFGKSLEESDCYIIDHLKFSDHYFYRDDDIKFIIERALTEKADIIITTEKDAARLGREMIDHILQGCTLAELSVSMQLINDDGMITK